MILGMVLNLITLFIHIQVHLLLCFVRYGINVLVSLFVLGY